MLLFVIEHCSSASLVPKYIYFLLNFVGTFKWWRQPLERTPNSLFTVSHYLFLPPGALGERDTQPPAKLTLGWNFYSLNFEDIKNPSEGYFLSTKRSVFLRGIRNLVISE